MKKRCIAMAITVAFAASMFGGVGQAQGEEDIGGENVTLSAGSNYLTYYDEIKSTAPAEAAIELDALDYTQAQGAQLAPGVDAETGENYLNWTNGEGLVSWSFWVPETALYRIGVRYRAFEKDGNTISLRVLFDGESPYDELDNITLRRLWENDGEVWVSSTGNQVAPSQREVLRFSDYWLTDASGVSQDPLVVRLEAGQHTISLEMEVGAVSISRLVLAAPQQLPTYEEALASYLAKGAQELDGEVQMIEGEDAVLKTSKSLVAKCDNSEASLSPSDPALDVVNYIGSTNWGTIGDTITWEVEVAQDGLYQLGYHYRQSYILGGISYRSLAIDGNIPFEEAKSIPFFYDSKWQYGVFEQEDGTPYYFYLTAGKHTLSLTVTMGPTAEINGRLSEVVLQLGRLYRQIVMITGETPDINRDYDLFGQIPDFEKNLTAVYQELQTLAEQLSLLTGSRSNSQTSVMRNMANTIERMLDHPYQATDYKSDFYSNYGSLGTVLYDMRQLPLDLDTLQLIPSKGELEKQSGGFMEEISFAFRRFIASFMRDYGDISGGTTADKEITIWLNWGRDQVQVLNNLICELFTPEYGIEVNVKIVNASLIQAMLSNNGPDLSLRLSRSYPVDYAMRGALYDLKNFPDYEEVMSRFMEGATVPYEFRGGCYAIPDTQSFYMLFYREDILAELGLEVPKTWDEFIKAVSTLARHNMQAGIPYTQISSITTTDAGIGALNLFPTILLQQGEQLYADDHRKTNLTSDTAIQAFRFWTDLYKEYSLPVTYDFYNRFRSGEMPLAIQPYSQYATISAAALEINGLWGMAEIPGFLQEDGTIRNAETGGGTGSAILNQSPNKEEAWTFLKWWTSADTQVRYTNELESILGTAERQTTANVEALQRLAWDKDDIAMLLKQWEKVEELPEVPGGYYTSRCVEQAYWNVINNGTNARATIVKWGKVADLEIQRKRAEYHLDG